MARVRPRPSRKAWLGRGTPTPGARCPPSTGPTTSGGYPTTRRVRATPSFPPVGNHDLAAGRAVSVDRHLSTESKILATRDPNLRRKAADRPTILNAHHPAIPRTVLVPNENRQRMPNATIDKLVEEHLSTGSARSEAAESRRRLRLRPGGGGGR